MLGGKPRSASVLQNHPRFPSICPPGARDPAAAPVPRPTRLPGHPEGLSAHAASCALLLAPEFASSLFPVEPLGVRVGRTRYLSRQARISEVEACLSPDSTSTSDRILTDERAAMCEPPYIRAKIKPVPEEWRRRGGRYGRTFYDRCEPRLTDDPAISTRPFHKITVIV